MTIADFTPTQSEPFDVTVFPAPVPLSGQITAQPSKNYTTRYLLAAALAKGKSVVSNCATSADADALRRCLVHLGARIEIAEDPEGSGHQYRITGIDGQPHLINSAPVNPGNAGAVLRFLLAVAALLPEVTFITDHPESLGVRPNLDLLNALNQLGCQTEPPSGLLPITLRGGNLHGEDVEISGAKSSQFLSGLLFLAPLIGNELRIRVMDNLVSKAPIHQTLEVLQKAGIAITWTPDLHHFTVQPGKYKSANYRVNGDWPGSAAILAAAAVTGGNVQILDLFDDQQGEKTAGAVLNRMGTQFSYSPTGAGVQLTGNGNLTAVEFDGDLATDAVLALMGAACFAAGRSRFYNVSNLRLKECDRISDPIKELRKLGVKCWEGSELADPDPDAIIIEGSPGGYEGGITVDGHDDHRVIMLLSTIALRCRNPVRIQRAHQISKSYPNYFQHLISLGAKIAFNGATS